MILKNKKYLFYWQVLFILFVSFFYLKINAQESKDAIAIRVMPNLNHLSAISWYKKQNFSGSPQAILVDGYGAVRDGRTVYVNVANVVGNNLYTNIYLISYNQEAEKETIDIFGKILSHWKFNVNLSAPGHCRKNNKITCFKDKECALGDFCDSLKARVIRDTKRLEDLSGINLVNPPSLDSGSYIPNFSISTWPSWENTLNSDFSFNIHSDPINMMGDCPSNYNPQTCWDENKKRFVSLDLSLPNSSMVYTYSYNPILKEAKICGVFESGLNIELNSLCKNDVCIDIDHDGYGVFASSRCMHPQKDCDDTNKFVLNAFETTESNCTDGIDSDCDGFIDCDDSDCGSFPACVASFTCTDVDGDYYIHENNPNYASDCNNVCGPSHNSSCYGYNDCNDNNANVNPGISHENCSSSDDDDCDGKINCSDSDCSGFPACIAPSTCTDVDGDYYIQENNPNYASDCDNVCGPSHNATCYGYNDCDDNNANIYPGHNEDCDGIDNNCDGNIDEGYNEENCAFLCSYNYNGSRVGVLRCCGDDLGEGNPYESHEITCDGVSDNDCDGVPDATDSDCTGLCGTTENDTGIAPCDKCGNNSDDDGDETNNCGDTEQDWINAGIINMIDLCDPDCGAGGIGICYNEYENPEVSCDGKDNDCDGIADNLGQTTCGEGICQHTIDNCVGGVPQTCDPFEGALASEDCNTPEDDDCDGEVNEGCATCTDNDGDHYYIEASGCSSQPGFLGHNDCNDNPNNRGEYAHPGGTETCDGLDNDCDGVEDNGCDDDLDGYCDNTMQIYNSNSMCLNTIFTADGMWGDDCDDDGSDAGIKYPNNTEACDGVDNNCDGNIDEGLGDEDCNLVCMNNGYTWIGLGNPFNCCGNDLNEQPYQTNEFSPIDYCSDDDGAGNPVDNDCDGLANCNDPDCLGHSPNCPHYCTLPFEFPCTFP